MRKTNYLASDDPVCVDISGLQSLTSCGRYTALKIATEAGAVITLGKRKIYNVERVRDYLNKISS